MKIHAERPWLSKAYIKHIQNYLLGILPYDFLKFWDSWFDAELAWRNMTNERQTDWLSFQTVLRYYTNPLEQDVPYNIIDFFMYSEEEIMQAFSGTLL